MRTAASRLAIRCGGGDQEMSAAAGRVADLQLEDRRLGVGLRAGLVEDRVERRVEQAVDQGRRRVVAARRLPLVPGGLCECERSFIRVDARMKFEQRLVDRPQLLRSPSCRSPRAEAPKRHVLRYPRCSRGGGWLRAGAHSQGPQRQGAGSPWARRGTSQVRGSLSGVYPVRRLLEEDLERLVEIGVGGPPSLRRELPSRPME